MMISVEGGDPPPFGLITPDALSPCLFTLLQQLGHEGVNKASCPSTAWIKTSARKLRSVSGPCQSSLCRRHVDSGRRGGSHTTTRLKVYKSGRGRASVSIRLHGTATSKNVRWYSREAAWAFAFRVCTVYLKTLTRTLPNSCNKTAVVANLAVSSINRSLKCTAPNWTSLSGTPLVVHPPHRQRQKKRNCSHVSTTKAYSHLLAAKIIRREQHVKVHYTKH